MLKYSFKIGDSNINIPLSTQFDVADKDEAIRDFYIEDQLKNYLPPEEDYEVSKYYPALADEVFIRVFKAENEQMSFADLGFTDDDLKFFYNRLQFSYLNLTFYTSNDKFKQEPVFVIDLFVQRINLFDTVNQSIKKADEAELIFNIKNPKLFNNETEGYFVYLKNNEFQTPFSLFCNFRFNNALNGTSYVLYPQKNLFANTVVEEDEYITANFSGNSFLVDTSNRTVQYTPNALNIDLYALNI
jgi:hypothetical protein